MSASGFVPKAYLKINCPFSFKFLLFLTEADLLSQFEVVPCDPEAADYEDRRATLARGTGRKATFPTVECAPGEYKSDSDALIEHYAEVYGVPVDALPTLRFYRDGLFPFAIGLFKENMALKAQMGLGSA